MSSSWQYIKEERKSKRKEEKAPTHNGNKFYQKRATSIISLHFHETFCWLSRISSIHGLWSFQTGDTKLERNLLNFEFGINGELSKSVKI